MDSWTCMRELRRLQERCGCLEMYMLDLEKRLFDALDADRLMASAESMNRFDTRPEIQGSCRPQES